MATTNRITIWQPGDVLTAAALNNEFNNILSTLNGSVDAQNVDLTDTYDWTGQHSFSNDIVGTIGATLSLGYYNLGVSLSAGLLSITTAKGNTLSTTDYGVVLIPSTTAGIHTELKVTATQSIQDASGSGTILGRWGTTASVAWGSAMPVYIGAVQSQVDSTTARFFLTRNPTMTTTPASTNNIGIAGTAPVTSSQSNMVLFGIAANTNYNSKPCIILGSLQMTIDNSAGGSATIGALVAGQHGFGLFQTHIVWDMVINQNGAIGGSYFSEAGGSTTLNYAGILHKYTMSRDGLCNILFSTGSRSASDASALILRIHLPYTSTVMGVRYGHYTLLSLGGVEVSRYVHLTSGNSYITLGTTGAADVNVGDVTGAGDNIFGINFIYRAF